MPKICAVHLRLQTVKARLARPICLLTGECEAACVPYDLPARLDHAMISSGHMKIFVRYFFDSVHGYAMTPKPPR
jgi:hypothetical protein